MMRSLSFTAREAMGWLRIMRPGSVIGEQQEYLCEVERRMREVHWGAVCAWPAPRRRLPYDGSDALSQQQMSAAPAALCGLELSAAAVLAAQVAAGMERRGAAHPIVI
jgi:hypothetical protein